ncbi:MULTISPECIES: DUF6246 family protein [Xenorhabdus]|uniref:DUF6246 family protein n=1 Tax=Xenorhabdus TaxID=626 RepID=UPI00064A41C0|nr:MULTISPECIES: DUF6246 family protein [Xenorhabdus]KLU16513.1 hypothetical protein AAY47_04570 [Xenorhabdus griffiniae]KOP32464.1 hypothetical protein AFK69_15305 [Xenorhabdus sp. GDc328]
MTPIIDIGEMIISTDKRDFFLRPSFAAMTRIGTPHQIVATYTFLNGAETQELINRALAAYGTLPDWLIKLMRKPAFGRNVLSTAMIVIQACCNDDAEELIGEWRPGRKGVVYRPGGLPINDIIVIACELITHGVIGRVKIRKLQRHEGTEAFSDQFKAIEYINAARTHFNMPREEAEQLTMTEFQMMLKAKFPDEKGFTREEYDAVIDADDQRTNDLMSGKRRLVSMKK